jgi:hypothetical protein
LFIRYAQTLAQRFLWIAIALHLVSAVALFLLSYFNITPIGYIAALAALLLTLLRPAQRLYGYVIYRLNTIAQKLRYPREDVAELRNEFALLKEDVRFLKESLDVARDGSWASLQQQQVARLQESIAKLAATLENFSVQNERAHELLGRKAESNIAKLSEDARALNQVRELVRFFKDA